MLNWNDSSKSNSLKIPKQGKMRKTIEYVASQLPLQFDGITENDGARVHVNGRRSVIYSHSEGASTKRVFEIVLDKGTLLVYILQVI